VHDELALNNHKQLTVTNRLLTESCRQLLAWQIWRSGTGQLHAVALWHFHWRPVYNACPATNTVSKLTVKLECKQIHQAIKWSTNPRPVAPYSSVLLYFNAVGWVFWPVKPTTESENRLQLDSLSTSVNIDHLIMVDNTSAVDWSRLWSHPTCWRYINKNNNNRQRQPPLSGAPVNKTGCQLSRGRDGSLRIQSLVEFLISSGHLCSPLQAVPDGLVMTTT